jgi:hypothetical protein
LEDLLGIEENNLPIPNAAEWELKSTKTGDGSLLTLFHCEPSPQAMKFVVSTLLPKYGWAHNEAGGLYSASEMSFRQTINTTRRSDRGFKVVLDRETQRILVSFSAQAVSDRHAAWLANVQRRVGLRELDPQPYWGLTDLMHKAGDKLHNCFFVRAKSKKFDGEEHFHYYKITILQGFDYNAFLRLVEEGDLYVDFDARSGHNHGTKFRVLQGRFHEMYRTVINVDTENVDLSNL